MSDCKPIISRKFIKTGGTEFDVLMGDGSVKDIRDLETFHGEHKITGTTIPTIRLISFLESWGSFTNTGSSVYIKMTDTIIPNSETAIGDIPLGKALIITYRVDCQILMWVHADNGNVYKYRNYIWSVDGGNSFNYITTSDVGIIVPGLDNGLLNPSVIPDLPPEIIYGFTLDDLNSLPDKDENTLYIDLNTRRQYYWNGDEFVLYEGSLTFATKSEAEAGIIVAKVMSPKTTKDAIEYHKVTANILGSTTLHGTSTNDTGIDSKVARKDHSHKIEGFSLTGHTHNNVLLHRPLTGDVVNMGTTNVIPIDATTFRKKNPSDFADHRQGELADTSIQDVKIGGVSTKELQDGKFIARLSKYPENKDFRLRELKDVPTPIVTNKVLVTTSNDGFEFKDYKSTLNYPTELTNLPTISVDAVNPTNLSGTPKIITGNLVLHPIVTAGTIKSLTGVQVEEEKEDDILQYKRGKWINTPLVGGVGEMKNLVFNNLGSSSGGGECPVVTYDGTIPRTISYNTIGAAPSVHTHNLAALTDVLFGELAADDILTYSGTKWTNTKKTAIATLKFNDLGSAPGGGGSPVINYNGTSSKIISFNTIGAAGANHTHDLDSLTDVRITTPQEGQLVTYHSGEWINSSVAGISNFIYDMAFVDKDGNDSTGQIGNINQPFATLQAAITATASGGDFILIHVMSNLTINSPIIIPHRGVTINLYNGIRIDYMNLTNDDNTARDSLFKTNGTDYLHIISNGSTTINCMSTGRFVSGFLDHNNGPVFLKGLNIKHTINSAVVENGSSYGYHTTIVINSYECLRIEDCHIHTIHTRTDTSSYSNIDTKGIHHIEISNSKLTLESNSMGGASHHIFSNNFNAIIKLVNCNTCQILPNFVNPTTDPTAAFVTPWTRIAVIAMIEGPLAEAKSFTLSNCKFYLGVNKGSRSNLLWDRFDTWPKTKWVELGPNLSYPMSICQVIYSINIFDIEHLGISLHNYGNDYNDSYGITGPAVTNRPVEYGGVLPVVGHSRNTSLLKTSLIQPYLID